MSDKNQILFVQGAGAEAHDQWDNKLVDSLRRELGPRYEIRYPRMPEEDDPHYSAWKVALLEEISALDDGAILVGHSIGGTMLINAIADGRPSQRLTAVLLIAPPFVGAGGWPSSELQPMADFGKRWPPETPIYLYHGSEDDTVPLVHVGLYEDAIPGAIVRRLAGRNHQLNDDLTEVAADIRALS